MLNRRPIVWFAVCWVFGSAAAAAMSAAAMGLAVAALVVTALALVLCRQATPRLAVVCLLGCSVAAGERLWADARNVTALPELLSAAEAATPSTSYQVEVLGVIGSPVEIDGDRAMFRVTAETVSVGGEAAPRQLRERLLVHVRLEQQPHQAVAAEWQRGDRVRIAGELTLPASSSNSGGFDYRRYLSSQKIHWLLKAKGIGAVEVSPGPGWSAAALLGRVDQARGWLGARLGSMYPSDQSGYMQGLVLGIREDLDPQQFQQFSRLGLTHILAISGLHVAVFMYVLGAVLRFMRMTRERMLVTLMFAVPVYVMLAGASPSVIRAGLMAVLGLLAARMDKLKDGLHLLAAAAVLMLAWEPYYIGDVSFQLSFIVTAGLIIGVPRLRKTMPDWKRGRWLLDLTAVTVVAQAASFPVSIYYFNQFHVLSLPANLLLVPFISSIVMPIGAIALFIGSFWYLGGKLLAIASIYGNNVTFWLVDQMAQVDFLRSIWATPPIWWIAAWYVLFIAAVRLLPSTKTSLQAQMEQPEETTDLSLPAEEQEALTAHPGTKWRSRALWLVGLGAAVLLFYAYYPDMLNRDGTVHILDVGQGDAIYVRTPEGKRMLIDGGGTLSFRKPGEEWRDRSDPFEVGKKVLVPLLMKRGVHKLDLLVISHLDSDHIRGLTAVIETIPVKGILWNGSMKKVEDAQSLLKLAVKQKIPLYRAEAGQQWKLGDDTALTVLWPEAVSPNEQADIPIEKDQNPRSVVLHLSMYNSSFLLTGDIDSPTESAINRLWRDAPPISGNCCSSVDVLKVAHHGSRYSTSDEWLRFWHPYHAVASVGATNTYGHPHPDVIGRLKSAGSDFLRTDVYGEVSYKANKKGLFVSTIKNSN
ncbi:DNA internalization-related competence protein ComEC/Rec2 [Paenibacillus sp. NPDC058174]|uniref:DNA internalization-related competence protein ComEC/Rec2 n=1 Tax=Paenibacillus sp. NPDC058174 TaxID=3346366 RepID=UPI0036DF0670